MTCELCSFKRVVRNDHGHFIRLARKVIIFKSVGGCSLGCMSPLDIPLVDQRKRTSHVSRTSNATADNPLRTLKLEASPIV